MVKKFLFKIVLLIIFSGVIFSKEKPLPLPGLDFNKRYLTDKELDELENPEITMENYEKFSHVFPQNGATSTYRLGKEYVYNNKFFQVQNDDTGRQWIHLSMDSKESVTSHSYLKNQLKSNGYFTLGTDAFVSFTFNLYSSAPGEFLQIFWIWMNKPMNRTLYQIFYKDGTLYLMLPRFSKGAFSYRDEVAVGNYKQGTEAKLKFEIKDNLLTVFYNDKKAVTQKITEKFDTFSRGFFQFGLYPGVNTKVYSEMFLTDLATEP
ncbi:MAG: hypothetical protein KBT11_01865 [Treponema sp.]|nr:hypothetical protein [Candidatus Treponema equifaecale]